ncbi:MAG: hypothetical protein DMG22_00220 [Acidobacteria bacterium]|nr:MAG: hypothetical protein DMG22_00220 [Acidobacteriota bacterium]
MTKKPKSGGTTSYTWDFENRLVSVTLPGTGGTQRLFNAQHLLS